MKFPLDVEKYTPYPKANEAYLRSYEYCKDTHSIHPSYSSPMWTSERSKWTGVFWSENTMCFIKVSFGPEHGMKHWAI